MSTDDRPKALDALLAAANLPNEAAATAKARAAIAPLEKAIRAAKAQERADLRGATLAAASEHLRTNLFPAVYEDAGQRTAEGVTRAADELLGMVGGNIPAQADEEQRAEQEAQAHLDHQADQLALEQRRSQLLEAMSGVSEERWCAGWMQNLDRTLHAEGGIWETLGRAVGWPTGRYGSFIWMSWDEAGRQYGPDQPTLRGALEIVESWFVDVNDGHGFDASDLIHQLEEAGYQLPNETSS